MHQVLEILVLFSGLFLLIDFSTSGSSTYFGKLRIVLWAAGILLGTLLSAAWRTYTAFAVFFSY